MTTKDWNLIIYVYLSWWCFPMITFIWTETEINDKENFFFMWSVVQSSSDFVLTQNWKYVSKWVLGFRAKSSIRRIIVWRYQATLAKNIKGIQGNATCNSSVHKNLFRISRSTRGGLIRGSLCRGQGKPRTLEKFQKSSKYQRKITSFSQKFSLFYYFN